MRKLHRYIGFFTIGIMMVYAFSGIVLTFRATTIFKVQKEYIEDIGSNVSVNDLADKLGFRSLNITKEEGDFIYFDIGNYNKKTGIAKYNWPSYPTWISRMARLHKTKSNRPLGWLNIISGVLLFFLAISSLWMYKPKTKNFKRGMIVSFAGIIFTIIILML